MMIWHKHTIIVVSWPMTMQYLLKDIFMIFSSDCHEIISKVENHENIQTYTATAIFMRERFNFRAALRNHK